MQKWEYLRIGGPSGQGIIIYKSPRLNDLASLLKTVFPQSKIKVEEKGGSINTDIWIRELLNFLGSEGWELIVAGPDESNLLFKRPFSGQTFSCQCSFFDSSSPEIFQFREATITVRDNIIETKRCFYYETIVSTIPLKNIIRVSVSDKKKNSDEDEKCLVIVMGDDAFQEFWMTSQLAEQLKNIIISAIC